MLIILLNTPFARDCPLEKQSQAPLSAPVPWQGFIAELPSLPASWTSAVKAFVLGTNLFEPVGVFGLNPAFFGASHPGSCCIPPGHPTPKPLPCLSQVQQRVPQPEHGREAPGADAAGLQAPPVQGGEVRGEGEDRPRPCQAAPGTGMLPEPAHGQGHRENSGRAFGA